MRPAGADGGAASSASRRSNLTLRLATAAIGLPVVIGLIYAGSWPLAIGAGAIAFLAAAEFFHGWLTPTMPMRDLARHAFAFGAPAVMVAGTHWDTRFVWAGLILAGLFGVAGYARTNAFGPRKPFRVQAWSLVYIGLLLSTLVLVRDGDGGREWAFLGLLATFAVDTGAYTTGRLLGRRLMAPAISPKKTWEGAAGGYVAGAGAVLGLNTLFDTGVSAVTMLPFALLMPIAAQAGDLFESWMKRRMGVKDASGLLPGHGGLLDRLDSILFVMPVLYVFLRVRVL